MSTEVDQLCEAVDASRNGYRERRYRQESEWSMRKRPDAPKPSRERFLSIELVISKSRLVEAVQLAIARRNNRLRGEADLSRGNAELRHVGEPQEA